MNRLSINLIRDVKYISKQTEQMTLSWKELVCHGLLVKVGDPSLIKELFKLVMKERFSFLEEEAREFHSRNVGPIISVYLSQCGEHASVVYELKRIAGYSRVARALCPENWLTAIRYKNVNKEFISTWKERIPEKRRRAVMMNKESKLLRWRGYGDYDITSGRARELDNDYHSIEDSIKWYGEIHEGRYYLFWDKNIAPAIKDWAERARRQRSSLMSGFDINIIDGEGLYSRISDTWIYGYEQWTKNPEGWGPRQFEFTMVHSIGKKEKMHIDDMFH